MKEIKFKIEFTWEWLFKNNDTGKDILKQEFMSYWYNINVYNFCVKHFGLITQKSYIFLHLMM